MKNIKLMLETTYSIDAIFELRKTSILISLFFLILISFMLITPFSFLLIGDNFYRWDDQDWNLSEGDRVLLEESLPKKCSIDNQILTCSQFVEINLSNGVQVLFNAEDSMINDGLIFNEDYLVFAEQGRVYKIAYSYFEDVDFQYATYEDIFSRLASSIKPIFIMPFILGAYRIGLLSTFIFTFVVASLGMLLKFKHANFLSYKEVLNLVIYSSTFPSVMALVIGMFNVGLGMIIYNIATIVVSYFVYKLRVIPYLMRD
ncbi:MAG: DUF1189 domain-containing protein [Turicibacter sp.]|nr:DUF1189 domain-containing protein [Turicibacter sp.]